MPPSDMVKKLSRTDHLALGFSEFLQTQGIIGKGDEDILVNPMPYTSTQPFTLGTHEVRFYQCFATSLCIPSKVLTIRSAREIRYNENLVLCKESVEHIIERDTLYIFSLNNSVIQLFIKSRLEKIKLLDAALKSIMLGIDKEVNEIRGVHSMSLFSDAAVLSLASLEPITVEFVGGHIVKLFIPRSDLLLISSKPYQQLLRDIYVHGNAISIKGSIKSRQALIEILDPITLAQPRFFDRGCVDLALLNPEDLDYNVLIKVYGYVDEVIIDELSRFKPRHSILRIALPAFARSKIRLCVSTYIPKRADIVHKLKMFEQASL